MGGRKIEKHPYCSVSFYSELSLEDVTSRIACSLFGGLPFEEAWDDEFRCWKLSVEVMGLTIRTTEVGSATGKFALGISPSQMTCLLWPTPEITSEELGEALDLALSEPPPPTSVLFPNRLDISNYIAMLLSKIDGITLDA